MKTKILLSILLSFYFCLLSSQVPQGFNYQAIATDAGHPITTPITVRITIQSDSITPGTIFWVEEHPSVIPNGSGLFSLVIGKGLRISGDATSFSDIDWSVTPKFIFTEINYNGWKTMGSSRLWAVPYSMVAGDLGGTLDKLKVKGQESSMDSALFEVKNNNGQTVFAVYNEGVRVYVDDGKKSAKGGFAIGGFGTTKAQSHEYFIVNADSIRAYIYDDPLVKSAKGGFAIGGFNNTKGVTNDYLLISPDSARVYVDNAPSTKSAKGGFAIGGFGTTKGTPPMKLMTVSDDSIRMYINDNSKSAKGGFAIGGFGTTKGGSEHFLDVATDASGIINPSQNRILWYPLKNAFLTGRVLVEKPDSVGINSFATGYESKSKGQYSQALGYKALARGDYSTAIGKNAVANNINSFAFGDSATALNLESYAIGRGAVASGYRSFAFGSAGVDTSGTPTGVARAIGDYSFAIGQGSKASGLGAFTIGLADTASGNYSLAMGYQTCANFLFSTTMGYQTNASGFGSIAMGGNSIASSWFSTATGYHTKASGYGSTTMGGASRAIGSYSVAMGYSTTASGEPSTAMGVYSSASGDVSTAMGYFLTAPSFCEVAIGEYNTTYTPGSTTGWNPSDRLFVIGNGNGTPSNAVTVLKNGCVGLQSIINPTYALQLPNNATISAGSGRAYAWTTYSDSRLKENQGPIVYGLKELMKLSPMQYIHHSSIDQSTWVNENSPETIGLIAQEVYKIIPEAVDVPQNNGTGLWGLNYDKLIPVLVKAIQEQQQQIESTNQENHQLRSQVQTLKEKIDQIETQQKEIDELKTLVNILIANQPGLSNK